MALLSPPLFLLPEKHLQHPQHHHSLSSTPSFPLLRSIYGYRKGLPSDMEAWSFHQWAQRASHNATSRRIPPFYQAVSSSSSSSSSSLSPSSSSPPWQKSTAVEEESPRKSPRHDKPSDARNGSSTTSFRPAPWQMQGSEEHRKYHASAPKGGGRGRYSRGRVRGRDEDGYGDRGRETDGYGYEYGEEEEEEDDDDDEEDEDEEEEEEEDDDDDDDDDDERGVHRHVSAWAVGSRTGQMVDWRGRPDIGSRDGDFKGLKEGNSGRRSRERDSLVRGELNSGTRQRGGVSGQNAVSKSRRREELPSEAKESWHSLAMVDNVSSSHLHQENGPVFTRPEDHAPSREEEDDDGDVNEETGIRASEKRSRRNQTPADLLIPHFTLKRLRTESVALEERLKIGKLGVTSSIVLSIQQQWNTSELVKVRCHGPAANRIKDTIADLERETGGLVVWRDKNTLVIYRGDDYKVDNGRASMLVKGREEDGSGAINGDDEISNFEKEMEVPTEMERLLESLGPRYEKWTGLRPIPIDADLLPPEVPNYRPPFRLLPFGERARLSDEELTNLRRLARPLGPHFVLGRNKGQQGLAVAILKLWEKTEIVKIAIKKRVQNTNNEMMAEQIWRLTGGILLSRDKFFITFYRGKDFVPQSVATTLTERELIARDLQEEEERARDERNIRVKRPPSIQSSVDVIRSEVPEVKPTWVHTIDIQEQERLKREVAKLHQLTIARQLERRLDRASKKKEKTEQELRKIEAFMTPIDPPADVETITEEERFMFRRLGMKMKSTLVLGRRGIFDGVVENMHFHWKHRELVKLVVNEPDPEMLQESARMLEYESGGILVAILHSSKGQEIIMYRGKNYQRPTELRPRNLLNKRKAFQRSIEMQRRASLIQNIQTLEAEILKIKAELSKLDIESDESFDQKYMSGAQSHLQPPTIDDEGEEEADTKMYRDRIKKLEKLVALGAIYRAEPLKNTERLRLRKKALALNKASQFFVGKSNDLEGLARGIRIYFLHHALVKVVVKGRGQGTSVQDLVQNLENLTGGVLVSQESNKIIMYRGWPEGDEMPTSLDSISPKLRAALEAEEGLDDDLVEGEDRGVFGSN